MNDLVAQALAKESEFSEATIWMSFCDPGKPKGEQFLGVIITRAKGAAHAMIKVHELGINPGGEILSYHTDAEIDPSNFDKLLSKNDLIKAGYIDE